MTGARPPIIDCDFHGQLVDLSVVADHLPSEWKGYLRLDERGTGGSGTRVGVPESVYWNRDYDSWRPLVAASGLDGEHATPLACAQRYLDELDVAFAVFNPGIAGGLSATGNAEYANAVGRAVNDWLVEEWLERDRRMLGSITITLRDPALAAEEIRRLGEHEQIAQVILAHPPRLLGDRVLTPVWEAASEYGLPVTLDARGAFTGMSPGLFTVGNPATRFEYEVSWIYGAQAHLLSLILGGTFDRFPDLRLILNGFGIAWLPSLTWRLEAEQRVCPGERLSPLSGAPEDYVRRHVRLTSSRLDLPDEPARLIELMALIGGAELMMLGSGPLGGVGELEFLIDALPAGWRTKVAWENAASAYRGADFAGVA